MKIITNNHWHNFLYGYELTATERADFDYLDNIDSHNFIRYRGMVIDPSEYMLTPEPLSTWQGYNSDSFFSGTVIRYSDDCEQYQIGTYIS